MRGLRALLVRRAIADHRLAADQGRPRGARPGLLQGRANRLRIMTVDLRDDMPAVCLEARRRVVRKPTADVAVDGDSVVVIQADELPETQRAGQRAGFVRNTLHHAAVAQKHVSVVVDDRKTGPVEGRCEQGLGQRHAHRVADALTERAGRRFHTDCEVILGVTSRAITELSEIPDLLDAQVIAGQICDRIQKHRTVPVRQHESVAVRPHRVTRVVAEKIAPQNLRDVGHSHRHAGVAGIGLLDGIHGQRANRIGQFPSRRFVNSTC